MRNSKGLAVLISILILIVAAWAQNAQIKHVPLKQTSAASGLDMYKNYCASCHGAEGKGNGPAASALKTPPADLTTLAKQNGGNYPSLKVAAILRGEQTLSAHGTKEMPIWGDLFWTVSGGHEAEVQQRITNLNKYVESLQK
jgi:mono/diheme cytochrome c family protein